MNSPVPATSFAQSDIADNGSSPSPAGGPAAVADIPVFPPARVLIIKPSSLGDIITALPALRGLKRSFPHCRVSWLVSDKHAGILANEDQIDEIIIFERTRLGRWHRSPRSMVALLSLKRKLREGDFDWTIDLQGLFRSGVFCKWTRSPVRIGFPDAREGATAFYTHQPDIRSSHIVDRIVELCGAMGIDARAKDMLLRPSPEGIAFLEDLANRRGLQKYGYFLCAPTTRWPTKTYPARHWRRVISRLSGTAPVILVAGHSATERTICAEIARDMPENVLDLSGKTNLQELLAVIRYASVVVCGDSAAKFIAAAADRPCITLIGPTRTEKTGPTGRGTALVSGVSCRGCLKKRCRHITCMQSIKPDLVCSCALEYHSAEHRQ